MRFFKLVLLSFGLSAIFLFIIFSQTSSKSEERVVERHSTPYQIVEVFADGRQGQKFSGMSDKTKLNEIAADLGAAPYPEDKLSVFPQFSNFYGRRITLYRAPTYIVYDQNKELTFRSFAATVGELLTEKKVILGQDDKINFSNDTKLDESMIIKIIRVAKTKVIESETINYRIIKKDDPNLEKGKTRVERAGIAGEKKLTYEVTRENGVEISKVLLSSEVAAQAVDEILLIGTKPVITVRCGKYGDIVLAASIKYNQDPNKICNLMMRESNGNISSENQDCDSSGNGVVCYGLFQYKEGLWNSASKKAGFDRVEWKNTNAEAQIYTTAFLFSIGQTGRW